MGKQKTIWRSIGIPANLFKQVRELIVNTGDPSVAEYVRFAIKERLRYDQERLENEAGVDI